MADDVIDRFKERLHQAEQTRDVGELVELFADDATLRSAARTDEAHGRDGAERFWSEYLSTFQEVRSRFTHLTQADGRAVLEWTSEGALDGGTPIQYEGVTVIEAEGGKIRHLRTYYDSAVFLPKGSKKA